MFARRVVTTLTKMMEMADKDIAKLTYKQHPVISQFGNAAFEMDVLLTTQWFAYNFRESITDALMIKHGDDIFLTEKEDLATSQLDAYRQHCYLHRLADASEEKVEIYTALALRALLFNGDAQVTTPVDYRTRLQHLESNVVVLKYTALAYSSLKSPNRQSLALSTAVTQELSNFEPHQVDSEIEHENTLSL